MVLALRLMSSQNTKNGKILTLDGVEIIDSTLLSRLTVTGGKLALDGVLVNGLNLSSITSDILPTTTTTLNLGSTGLKFSNVWSSVINTSTLKIDTASITFDGTVLKLGTDTLATREWVNSSAIPVLKTINGQSITGTGDITIVGGSVTPKKYFARISNGTATSFVRGVTTQIPLSTFGKGDQELHNGTSGFIAPQDDVYTITGQFFSSTSTEVNVNEIGLICYVNGIEEGRAWLNPGVTGGSNKGCNLTVNTRLNKNDVVTFTLQCWASDTTTSLSVPVGSLVATIRN